MISQYLDDNNEGDDAVSETLKSFIKDRPVRWRRQRGARRLDETEMEELENE